MCSDPDAPTKTCESGRSYPTYVKPLGSGKVSVKPDYSTSQDLQQKKPRGEGRIIDDPEGPTTTQISSDGISGIYITVFPEGSVPAQDRTSEELNSATDSAGLGLFIDVLEGIAIAYPGDLFIGEYVMSAVDIGVTGRSCYLYGQCYVGRPDPSLPNMLIVNQDVLITGLDFAVPIVGGLVAGIPTGGAGYYPGSVATDLFSTGGSLLYDISRVTGVTPNFISAGWTLKGDLYILIYP
jgi:hypothetical protein